MCRNSPFSETRHCFKLTCFGSQGFIVRLDVFSAQTQGQVSTWQPLSVFQLQMTQNHGAIDVIDDKSQIFVHICSQQYWSWRVQPHECKIDFPEGKFMVQAKHLSTRPLVRSRRKNDVVTRDVRWVGDQPARTFLEFSATNQHLLMDIVAPESRMKFPSKSKLAEILVAFQPTCERVRSCLPVPP